MDNNVFGQKVKVEREHLRQFYFEQLYGREIACKPIKDIYNLGEGLFCGGSFIIYEDQTALLIHHGSGMHYVYVYRGFIK